jgi:hypothetical protein
MVSLQRSPGKIRAFFQKPSLQYADVLINTSLQCDQNGNLDVPDELAGQACSITPTMNCGSAVLSFTSNSISACAIHASSCGTVAEDALIGLSPLPSPLL